MEIVAFYNVLLILGDSKHYNRYTLQIVIRLDLVSTSCPFFFGMFKSRSIISGLGTSL